MTILADDIQRHIDQIAALRPVIGDAAADAALAALYAQLPSSAPDTHMHGTVSVGEGARVSGPAVGINLGTIIYGRSPHEEERRRIEVYLQTLATQLHSLPMQHIVARLNQRGEGMAMSHVYTMLATRRLVEMATGDQDAMRLYLDDAADDGLKRDYHPDYALPSDAIMHRVVLPTGLCTLSRALLATEAVRDNRRLVLLGAPGSGKSTFLRYLAWTLAQRELGIPIEASTLTDGLDSRIPIIVPLQTLARRLATDGTEPATVLATVQAEMERYGGENMGSLLREALNTGVALLLFDGLDEVPADGETGVRADRMTTIHTIRAFISTSFPNAHVVLTCRTRVFTDTLRDSLGWPVEEVARCTLGQVRHFVPAWYNELVARGHLHQDRVESLTDDLITAIATRPRLREMATTPLLLTMMASVLHEKGALPRDRPMLYQAILELLLGQWDRGKDGQTIGQAIGYEQWHSSYILPVLDSLSYNAHREATSQDGRGQVQKHAIRDALERHFQETADMREDQAAAAAIRCLNYIDYRSGILMPDGPATYVFAHLTLQEHCAGRHIALGSDNPVQHMMQLRGDDRWREPMFLGIGLADQRDVNDLLRDLIDTAENEQPKPPDRWYQDLILAAEIGEDRDWHYLKTQPRVKVDRIQRGVKRGLVALLNDARQPLTLSERVRAGVLLGMLGDPRVPVTVDEWQHEIARALAGDTSPGAYGELPYFCKVEAGTYIIGSCEDDPDAEKVEKPQHTVTFTEPFWIARYPITNAQWHAWHAHDADASKFAAPDQSISEVVSGIYHTHATFLGANQPAVRLDWDACNAMCAWLSEQTGTLVVLPTEYEWEAAARGGDDRPFPWGSVQSGDYVSFQEDSTSPVGCCAAGAVPCGAMDMVGNVWEWMADCFRWYTDGSLVSGGGTLYVKKGGLYATGAMSRCATRRAARPYHGVGSYYTGFRVVIGNEATRRRGDDATR